MAEDTEKTLEDLAPSEKEASELSSSDVSEVTEQETPEQVEQKERSKLGRKLAKVEEEVGSIKYNLSRLDRIEAMLASMEARNAAVPPSHVEDEDPDRVLTVRELQELRRREEYEQQVSMQRYQDEYIRTVKGLYAQDPVNHVLIERELLTNVSEYPTWSNRRDARADAIANYWKARAKIIEGKLNSSAPNVRGGSNAPTGVTTSTRQTETPRKRIQVDEVASKFAKAMGMDDDYVQTVLSK